MWGPRALSQSRAVIVFVISSVAGATWRLSYMKREIGVQFLWLDSSGRIKSRIVNDSALRVVQR